MGGEWWGRRHGASSIVHAPCGFERNALSKTIAGTLPSFLPPSLLLLPPFSASQPMPFPLLPPLCFLHGPVFIAPEWFPSGAHSRFEPVSRPRKRKEKREKEKEKETEKKKKEKNKKKKKK